MINAFSKTNLKVLREDMNAALAAVADKHGITLEVGNARFTESEVSFKLKGIAGDPEAVARENVLNDRHRIRGLSFEEAGLLEHGKEFTSGASGNRYRITGINLRRHKFPISAQRVSDGAPYKFPAREVVRALRGQ